MRLHGHAVPAIAVGQVDSGERQRREREWRFR